MGRSGNRPPFFFVTPIGYRRRVDRLDALRLDEDGAERRSGAALSVLGFLHAEVERLPPDRPGVRLDSLPQLMPLLEASGPIGQIAARILGDGARPVRTILFDKSPATNWRLGWHQDRTIAVRRRHAVPGFGPWTVKAGIAHVAPPFDLLTAMITLRVHLDRVPEGNAPLRIAPGSHRRFVREMRSTRALRHAACAPAWPRLATSGSIGLRSCMRLTPW